MIEVSGLSKSYTYYKKEAGFKASLKSLLFREKLTKEALKGASLKISEGEIVGLIGANGAGKTTLVKLLSGIIYPTNGDAKILGYTPWERPRELQRQVSLIMGQKAQLWWDLPADDCFLLLKEIYQIPDDEFYKRKKQLAELLDAEKVLNVQIRRLSLGERMKMELMAALLHRPKVVFLDEPTIGLDLTAQQAIRRFILDYQKQFRPAMILTSHYMEDIEQLCKRIIIMREGQIVYDGDLQRVVAKYAQHKRITVVTAENKNVDEWKSVLPSEVDVISSEESVLKLKVKRDLVSKAAAQILSKVNVTDLNVEEPDISEIIENILRQKESVS